MPKSNIVGIQWFDCYSSSISKNNKMLMNYSGMNTITPSPNYTVMNEHCTTKNISFSGTPNMKTNMVSSKYKRKLSLKGGHSRSNTETTLMERIMKVFNRTNNQFQSSKNQSKPKNKSKIMILNHLQKKFLNMNSSKSRDTKSKEKKIKSFVYVNSARWNSENKLKTNQMNNKTTTPSPIIMLDQSRSRSRAN